MSDNIWGYQETSGYSAGGDLAGYKVEATDGHIGKVDKHSDEVDAAYLVVDVGVWIFGKHVLLPAGTVRAIDAAERKVFVDLTKDQIKNAPEFDKDRHLSDTAYQQQVGEHYTREGRI